MCGFIKFKYYINIKYCIKFKYYINIIELVSSYYFDCNLYFVCTTFNEVVVILDLA